MGWLKNHPTKVETVKEAAKSDRFGPDFGGMPTLRKFIRFNDWQRVEKIFQKVVSQMEGEGPKKKHYTLRSPLLPGIFLFGEIFICVNTKKMPEPETNSEFAPEHERLGDDCFLFGDGLCSGANC